MVEAQLMQWGMAILVRTGRNSRVQRRDSYRAGGIRTRGLLHPRQALYQAEPQPELIAVLKIKRSAHLFRVFRSQWQGRISEQLRNCNEDEDSISPDRCERCNQRLFLLRA
jgi:hypothetical protein